MFLHLAGVCDAVQGRAHATLQRRSSTKLDFIELGLLQGCLRCLFHHHHLFIVVRDVRLDCPLGSLGFFSFSDHLGYILTADNGEDVVWFEASIVAVLRPTDPCRVGCVYAVLVCQVCHGPVITPLFRWHCECLNPYTYILAVGSIRISRMDLNKNRPSL